MKKTIQELANETTTSSTGISDVQGEEWLKEILATAKQKMFFDQFAFHVNVPKGVKDMHVPISTSHLSFTSVSTEASARTLTEVTNLTVKTFTPVSAKYGAAIAKEVMDTSQVDVVKWAREEMAYNMALDMDKAFASALESASSPAATLYGGDASATNNLASGDILTTDLIAKAQRYLKANGWYPENSRPFVLFIPAVAEESLLKDSQFVNASEYGSDRVVANGEIGEYLGIRVIVSEQCPSYSNWGSGSLAGHVCFLVKAQVAYGIAIREKPTLDWEYKKDEAAHYIYLDTAFKCDTLQENAIVVINVSDA